MILFGEFCKAIGLEKQINFSNPKYNQLPIN